MSEKILRIFELCKQLAELLGDKNAIADIKRLYDKHPDMFNDVEEVARLIKEVAKEPKIITNAKAQNAILAAKRLTEPNKMGDIVIQNSKGINIVIHANKKREKEFNRLKDSLVATPTPTTHQHKLTGELTTQSKNESFGANALLANQKELESVKNNPNTFTPLVDFQKQQTQSKIIQQSNPKSQGKSSKANKKSK